MDVSCCRVRVYKFIILFTIVEQAKDGFSCRTGKGLPQAVFGLMIRQSADDNSLTRKGFLCPHEGESLDGIRRRSV